MLKRQLDRLQIEKDLKMAHARLEVYRQESLQESSQPQDTVRPKEVQYLLFHLCK